MCSRSLFLLQERFLRDAACSFHDPSLFFCTVQLQMCSKIITCYTVSDDHNKPLADVCNWMCNNVFHVRLYQLDPW